MVISSIIENQALFNRLPHQKHPEGVCPRQLCQVRRGRGPATFPFCSKSLTPVPIPFLTNYARKLCINVRARQKVSPKPEFPVFSYPISCLRSLPRRRDEHRSSAPASPSGELQPRAACGRKSEAAISAAVGKHEDQRKPEVFSDRKVEEVPRCPQPGTGRAVILRRRSRRRITPPAGASVLDCRGKTDPAPSGSFACAKP